MKFKFSSPLHPLIYSTLIIYQLQGNYVDDGTGDVWTGLEVLYVRQEQLSVDPLAST